MTAKICALAVVLAAVLAFPECQGESLPVRQVLPEEGASDLAGSGSWLPLNKNMDTAMDLIVSASVSVPGGEFARSMPVF